MTFETTLIYTEPLLRHSVFGFWRRTVGVRVPIVIVALAALLTFLIFQGDRSWLVGVLGAESLLVAAGMVGVYFVHYRNTMKKFREMGKPEAIFRADESTFTVSTGIATSTAPWTTIKEIWQFRDVWLLLFSKAQFITLPKSCVPAEMQAFILDRVRGAGGKIS